MQDKGSMNALRQQPDSLENICFFTLASMIHKSCTRLEESSKCDNEEKELSGVVCSVPSLISEKMIVKVIDTIHQEVRRTRQAIGIKTCLNILLQPGVHSLDLDGLFFKMRFPVHVNCAIQAIVNSKVEQMKNLEVMRMVSNCSDEIMCTLSQNCKNLKEIIISISNLVTDCGVKSVIDNCDKLEILGLYKCWEVTNKGLEYALRFGKNLMELQCETLGEVLFPSFVKTDIKLNLTHFEQSSTLFRPTFDQIEWLSNVCKNLQSIRIFTDDSSLKCISLIGPLKKLHIEILTKFEDGLHCCISKMGIYLTTLQLNCNKISQGQLLMLGKHCVTLDTLHLLTTYISGDHMKSYPQNERYFPALSSICLQVSKDPIDVACVDFFMVSCLLLDSIMIGARMSFFTDRYLMNLLQVTNFKDRLRRLTLISDDFVPCHIATAYSMIATCHLLEAMKVSSWQVTEEEFRHLREFIRQNNLRVVIN